MKVFNWQIKRDPINPTNTKKPKRIDPDMEALLLKVETDLGENSQHWSSIQCEGKHAVVEQLGES